MKVLSPQLMYVVAVISLKTTVIIVGHAPHNAADEQLKSDFWTKLCAACTTLCSKYDDAFWTLLLDANARVGGTKSLKIGPAHCVHENDNGSRVRRFAEDYGFTVSSTFFQEVDFTWTSTYGTRARIDHVLTKDEHHDCVKKCWSEHGIDLTFNA